MHGVYVVKLSCVIWEGMLICYQAHAHIATLHYLSTASNNPPSLPSLALALKHFCRSIELNDSYLRGYYGIKLLTSKLIPLLSDSPPTSNKRGNSQEEDDVPLPKLATAKKLEEIATNKLGEIVRNASAGKQGWTGYDKAEVIAARELLDRDGKIER
jgi:hypothetical protein